MPMSAEIVNRAQSRLGMVLNGKWRLDEILGVGGMATVYAAMHRNQKRVAVKMLHTELSLEEGVRTRFLREGYVANTVDHPSAVTVFDDDIAEDGSAFLVMELLEGETIHARILRDGNLPVGDALRMADEVLDVLAAAHGKHIIHRDLKPENLFITRDGHVKVLDFGIARLRELSIASATATASGFFMGTPAFMAPEHARGKWSEVDARSDLWSVGATLFTMLTGKFVHDSDTAMDTLVMAVTRRAPPIRTVMPELDSEVALVVDRALAFEQSERWASAAEMQAALRASASQLFSGQVPTRAHAEERPPLTPTFASPPQTPQRGYQATVRSAGPPARAKSDAPLTSSVAPALIVSAAPPRERSPSGVSVTGSGSPPPRRRVTTFLVAAASLFLLALGAASVVRQAGRTGASAAGDGADVARGLVAPTAGAAEGRTLDDDPGGSPRETVGALGPRAPSATLAAASGSSTPMLAGAQHVARGTARVQAPLRHDAGSLAAAGSASAVPPTSAPEVAPPANTNPFDRRF